jgi:lysophospholipase L1-like esterase
MLMGHIVLLGDSVFDNAAYVEQRQEVLEKVRDCAERGWQATLLARDGAVLDDVRRQIERLPSEATHLFISAGGNDALRQASIFSEAVSTVGEAMAMLGGIRRQFQQRYRNMLDLVLSHHMPTTICTIYDARFPDPALRDIANTALAVLNDVITREAGQRGLPLLDLRVLFNEDADFANAIEPSARGGEKLGQAIVEIVAHHDFAGRRSTAYVGPRRDKYSVR